MIIDLVAFEEGYINNFETDADCDKIIVEQGLLTSMTAEKQNEEIISGEYSLKVTMQKAPEGAADSWPCIRIPFISNNISNYENIAFDIYNSGDAEITICGCLYNVNGTRGDDSSLFTVAVGEKKTIVLNIDSIKGALDLEDVTGVYLWVPIFSDADREYILDNVRFTNETPVIHEFEKVNSATELLTAIQNGTEYSLFKFYGDGTFKQTVTFGDVVHNVPAGMTQTSGDYGWAGGFLINDGSFVQANLMNNSVVKFAYEATSNCYVVLNLGVETWADGTYAFKVLVNDEVVYSKEAARESDVFAALTNQVVYLAEGDTLALSFNTVIPEGHTGNYESTIIGVESVDIALARVIEACEKAGAILMVTADHGNAEQLVDYETGAPFTAHTTNEVPFILVNYDEAYTLREGGCLADIIPTLIEVMGKEQPAEMTGKSLLIKK